MQQRIEQDLAVTVRTFCVHTVVVQEQDFARGSCPASVCPINGAASSLPCPCCLHLNQLSKALLCPCFWVNTPHKPPRLWEFHTDSRCTLCRSWVLPECFALAQPQLAFL